MFNVLIINNDFNYSKKLINYLSKNNPKVRIVGIATNTGEALHCLSSEDYSIDIIIVKMSNSISNDLFHKLKQNDINKYNKSFIVISDEITKDISKLYNFYLYSYIQNSNNFNIILNCLNTLIKLIELNRKTIQKKILKELHYLNFNDKLVGTKYLLETILLIAQNQPIYSYNLKGYIYPIIASRHNKTVHNIKCNINNATVIMNCECKKQIIMEYFKFSDFKAEAKPKQVIDTILNKITNIEDII